jgi:hypothetical protein
VISEAILVKDVSNVGIPSLSWSATRFWDGVFLLGDDRSMLEEFCRGICFLGENIASQDSAASEWHDACRRRGGDKSMLRLLGDCGGKPRFCLRCESTPTVLAAVADVDID